MPGVMLCVWCCVCVSDAAEETPLVRPHPEDTGPPHPVPGLEALPDHPPLPHRGSQRAPPPAQIHTRAHALWSLHLGWDTAEELLTAGVWMSVFTCTVRHCCDISRWPNMEVLHKYWEDIIIGNNEFIFRWLTLCAGESQDRGHIGFSTGLWVFMQIYIYM